MPRLVRNGKADDGRAHGRPVIGNDTERELIGRAKVGDQRVELFERRDQRVVLLDAVRRWRVFGDERAKRESREQLVAAFARGPAVAERLEVDLQRDVGANGDQLPALQRRVSIRGQRLPLLRLQLGRAREQRIEAAELRHQIDRALLADARHAGDVVARIPDQREHVHDQRRLDAELLDDASLVEPRAVLPRVVDADSGANHLKEVLVDRYDRDIEPGCDRPCRDRADHVVGLVAFDREDRDARALRRPDAPS